MTNVIIERNIFHWWKYNNLYKHLAFDASLQVSCDSTFKYVYNTIISNWFSYWIVARCFYWNNFGCWRVYKMETKTPISSNSEASIYFTYIYLFSSYYIPPTHCAFLFRQKVARRKCLWFTMTVISY